MASLYFAFAFRKGSAEGGATPPPTTTTTPTPSPTPTPTPTPTPPTPTPPPTTPPPTTTTPTPTPTKTTTLPTIDEGRCRVGVYFATDYHRLHLIASGCRCRVGVYFGSFDPVHENHVAVAQHAQHAHGMRFVYLVSNADNPRKPFVSALRARAELIDVRSPNTTSDDL